MKKMLLIEYIIITYDCLMLNKIIDDVKNSVTENCNFLVDVIVLGCSFQVKISDCTPKKISSCIFMPDLTREVDKKIVD